MSSNAGPSTKRSSPRSEANSKKAGYNKATAKCTPRNRSYHTVEDCWFGHPKKAKAIWLACNPSESIEQPINLLTMGTLSSNLEETTVSLPTKPKILVPAEQSSFLPDTLVSPASRISFTMPENNEPMPIDVKDPSSISFEGISELDLDLLDIFSQEETSSLNEKFQPVRYEDSNIYLEMNKDAVALGFDQPEILEDWNFSFMTMRPNAFQTLRSKIQVIVPPNRVAYNHLSSVWHIDSRATSHIYAH